MAEGESKVDPALYDSTVEMRVMLGQSTVRVRDLLKLGRGAVVELNRTVSDRSDVLVYGVLVARGEVTLVEDRLAITITEVLRSNR